jgi:serine/threonine protein kinase
MGCGASAPQTVDVKPQPSAASRQHRAEVPKPSPVKKPEQPVPDPGLVSTHEAIKPLGKGGTGDTWLYKDRTTGELVAVKLMKRPLPKVVEPHIQREIRVCSLLRWLLHFDQVYLLLH